MAEAPGPSTGNPVSLAVIGGMTTSTFLTLLILPPVYTYMDDLSRGVLWLAIRVANPGMLLPAPVENVKPRDNHPVSRMRLAGPPFIMYLRGD